MSTKTKPKPKAAPKQPPVLPHDMKASLSKDQIGIALGIGKKWLDRKIACGEFPKPDGYLGSLPRWRVDTFNAWFDKQFGRIIKEE